MKIAFRIVSIFIILAITSTIAFWLYVVSFGDSSVELKRGNVVDELLLRSPVLRHFPEKSINGTYRYFYSPSEAGEESSNGLIILMTEFNSGDLNKCVRWFEKFNYTTSGKIGQSHIIMTNDRGQKASIKVDKNEIIINVSH